MTDPTAKPWWQSRTIIGALVSLLAVLAGAIGLPLTETDQVQLTNVLVALGGAAGTLLTILGRIRASRPVKGGGVPPLAAFALMAALGLGGPVACAYTAAETPAQKIYAIQSDYQAVQRVATAYLETDRAGTEVVAAIRRLDAAAYSAVGEARRAVRVGDSPAIPAALAAARHAVMAFSDYMRERRP